MGFFDFMKMSVDIDLAQTVVFPGNILNGVAKLNVTGDIEFVGIRLIARGVEYVKVAYEVQEGPDSEGNYRTVTHYTENTRVWNPLDTGKCPQMPTDTDRYQQIVNIYIEYFFFSFSL